ncbi:DeoR/GlpR family DNA-binding transcription regulator [Albidovulum sediminicola]|uniref:DeoR/GlpR family DNA-binding transcription regulator n=1 Tax=Albidovulum sediminicola TaxID=2984331 RepID=A0ABT2YX93_9RHOB|nr:DeoR/GlpR family DNA-binding transcription regulator [Defluviimonas sp. WL0075]MCV2863492.1 DeoR/GlpR family DNA-binding transcription regulator [Defluviimonas sp. WL0075]
MPKSRPAKASHREHELLEVLRRYGGSARNGEIARVLDVSEETVRRLAKRLERDGQVERMHGGTLLAGAEPGFHHRAAQNTDGKSRIAAAVAEEIQDGMCLFLDVGSTTKFVAEALRVRHRLMVVTNSLLAAQALANHNDNRVFLTGGELGGEERGSYGPLAEAAIRGFAFDAAILSANGVSERAGFTVYNPAEASIARLAASRARRCIVCADQEKFGREAPVVTVPVDGVDLMVTDRAPPEPIARALALAEVVTMIARRKE